MDTVVTEAKAWLNWAKRRWWVVYLLLLAYSQVVLLIRSTDEPGPGPASPAGAQRYRDDLRGFTAHDPLGTPEAWVSYLVWNEPGAPKDRPWGARSWPAEPSDGRPTVVLLHGSPGDAGDFAGLAPLLVRGGYRVVAIDLPGYGESVRSLPDYSARAQAAMVREYIGSRRPIHLVGWSLGGAVALELVDLLGDTAKDRVASLTLMASLGVQEAEGSGDYYFEHFKYAAGYGALFVAPELIPHFGLLGARSARHSFIRNFWDTDQRPLRGIMERITVPTLILHGRNDVLVPAWAAETHHRLILTSRLVMLDANHFLPFMQAEESAKYLVDHFKRHDAPGVAARTDTIDLSPVPVPRTWLDSALAWSEPFLRSPRWPAEITAIVLSMLLWPVLTVVICGVLVAHQQIDLFEALVGLSVGWLFQAACLWLLGRVLGERAYAIPILGRRLPRISEIDWHRRLTGSPIRAGFVDQFVPRRRPRVAWALGMLGRADPSVRIGVRSLALTGLSRVLGAVVWSLCSLLAFLLLARQCIGFLSEHLGGVGTLIGIVIACFIVAASTLILTRSGRSELRARFTRLRRHEYWHPWLFYAPVFAYALYLARKHGGFMVPSCCNPGIEAGGGVIGESKHGIMKSLAEGARAHSPGAVLPTFLIPPAPSPEARAAQVEALVDRHGALSYPVILKPDEGQRGYAVRLVRTPAEVLGYFSRVKRAAVVQPYHPGPQEAGILWARRPGQDRGFIFSITRKLFPSVTGDGRRSLEQLIESHPRYRCQAAVYLERFADRASEIIPAGQMLRLAVSGNHCQGTLFADGGDLITPELEGAIDDLARNFAGRNGADGLLDFGRFDVRYASDEDLRAGRNFAVLELNGTFSESTNLYDPGRSVFWAYGVLARQWRTLYELGAYRRDRGAAPLSFGRFLGMIREHFKHRDGPAIAD